MMKNLSALLLTGVCAFVPAAVYASGGTCLSPSTAFQDGADSGNTCTDGAGSTPTANEVSAFCGGGQVTAGQPQEIYTVVLSAPGTGGRATQISITGGSATFTPTVYLYTGTCANGGGCVATGTAAVPADISAVAAGTYLMAVGGSQLDPNDATACGAFTISANGTLPVKLQSFSVQ
jgi:hypothetical protein